MLSISVHPPPGNHLIVLMVSAKHKDLSQVAPRGPERVASSRIYDAGRAGREETHMVGQSHLDVCFDFWEMFQLFLPLQTPCQSHPSFRIDGGCRG